MYASYTSYAGQQLSLGRNPQQATSGISSGRKCTSSVGFGRRTGLNLKYPSLFDVQLDTALYTGCSSVLITSSL